MREIKFRLLYKGKIVGYEIHIKIQETIQLIHSATNLSYEEIMRLWDKRSLKFGLRYAHDAKQQYTGLKDKNGKEIYEGDIIRTKEYNEKWNDGAVGDVTWDEEGAQFRFNWKILLAKSGEKDCRKPVSTICSSSAYLSDNREGGIEVIGNIYSNPELLK